MSPRFALLPLALLAAPAWAEEITCTGAFAIDSSEAQLVEIYGEDNVWTGIVPGPEGTEMLATEVFRDNPKKRLQFVWWDEDGRKDPSYIELTAKMVAPGGVRVGMSMAEVEALNGEPFTLSGFGWDYGGYASFPSGALADPPGDCLLSIRFAPDDEPVDTNVDAVYGDHELVSSDPLLAVVGAHVDAIAIGYPHPDFRD